MCGIFGVISARENVAEKLLTIGKRLAYRGYDSAGLATYDGDKIDLRKDTGTIEGVNNELNLEAMKGQCGIGQLRWSTFGRPTKVNAQPHFDCDQDMVGAHNGNIVSFYDTKDRLEREGHEIKSMNDGEICVHAVEKYYDQHENMITAIRSGIDEIEGDFAFVTFHADEPEKIYAVKMGSSLVVGVGEDEMYVASDLPSILPLTQTFVPLNNGEIVELTPDSYQIYRVEDGTKVTREPRVTDLSAETAVTGEYDYFLTKEIHEQVETTEKLSQSIESDMLEDIVTHLTQTEQLFLLGCGSSYNASMVGAYYLNNLAGLLSIPVIGGKFLEEYRGYEPGENTGILCVSQSGETKDIINAIHFAEPKGYDILSILNVPGSTVERLSDSYAYIGAGIERSVAATKTYTNQVVLFLTLATRLARVTNQISTEKYQTLKQSIEQLPSLIQTTLERSKPKAKRLASELRETDAMSILGYGVTHGVAKEGALKIREINYISAESMYSSEFKHGPLSIVEDGYPVVYVVAPEDEYYVTSHVSEVECRDGRPIVVGEPIPGLQDYVEEGDYFQLPEAPHLLSPILAAIPLQLLALYMSLERDINPDYPRNLSKTLTVD